MAIDIITPIREVAAYRELLGMLAWRDIRVRYRQSLLGAAWAVAPAALTMLVFVFVFRHTMGLEDLTGGSDLPYPLFAMAGLVPWTFLSNGLNGAVGALLANRSLVTKVCFPREVFPLASILAAGADFLVAGALVVALAAGYAFFTPWEFRIGTGFWLLPLVVAVQLTLMIGAGLLLAMGNLYYRDVGFIFRALLPLMMFVTNVVYPLRSPDPAIDRLIRLNPMVPILDGYRAALSPDVAFPYVSFGIAAALSLMLCAAGWALFHAREYEFAERI